MRVVVAIASVAISLPLAGCGWISGSDKISNKEMSEAFGRSMSDRTLGPFNLSSADARRQLREAKKNNEGIEAGALGSDFGRVIVFNGMANGLFTLKAKNASPWFGFAYAKPGWEWLEKAMDKKTPPLELDVRGVKNLECFTSDEGDRRCAANIRFKIRPSGHWKKVLGPFTTAEFEGRPVFVKTLESGEWRVGAWGKPPELVGKPSGDDDNDAGLERDDPAVLVKAIVQAMNAQMAQTTAKKAIDQISAILRPHYNQSHLGGGLEAAAADQRLGLVASPDPAGGALTLTPMYGAPIQIALGGQATSTWTAMQSCWASHAAGHTDWRLLTAAELGQLSRPMEGFDQSYEAWTESLLGRPLVAPDKSGATPDRVDDLWSAASGGPSMAPPMDVAAPAAAYAPGFAPVGGRMILAGPVWRFLKAGAGPGGGFLVVGDAMGPGTAGVYGPLTEAPSTGLPGLGGAPQANVTAAARAYGTDGALRYAGQRSGDQAVAARSFASERKALAVCARAA